MLVNWVYFNLFILAIGLIAVGSLYLLGLLMLSFGLMPDDHPMLLTLGAIGCLFLTYYAGKWMHSRLSR